MPVFEVEYHFDGSLTIEAPTKEAALECVYSMDLNNMLTSGNAMADYRAYQMADDEPIDYAVDEDGNIIDEEEDDA